MEIKQVNFVGSKPEYQEYNTRDVDLIEQKLTLNFPFVIMI